jgi:arylesterase/paraoxonase
MRKSVKVAAVICGTCLFGISFYLVRGAIYLGALREVSPHFKGTCVKLAGVTGAEDIAIDHESGIAYISASDRRARFSGDSDIAATDGIYRLDLSGVLTGESELQYLPTLGLSDFRPHGIDLVREKDGKLSLYAVNHPRVGGHRIDIFTTTANGLVYRKSVEHELLRSPNDIAVEQTGSFYVTNDHFHDDGLGRILEDLLMRDRGNVVYWDGREMRIAADGLTYANGVAFSWDGRQLYVTETLDQKLRIYSRDGQGGLALRETLPLNTGLDNIAKQPDGSFLIGAHPSLWALWGHLRDEKEVSPSQVIWVRPRPDGQGGEVDELYLNNGEEISGSSSAARYQNILLISAVFAKGILVCQME